ncbi:LOW QUALITY PROTEIN: inositol-trisphosphate 3-kinase B [Palaemon carinicauda]|uniref:LOW QUALITY PROTEIN: inositol-trisphosphate 3-kinase B n=1 Tax=Palaemon carinicauda TaxID=392227 RepID=UPI0035B6431C
MVQSALTFCCSPPSAKTMTGGERSMECVGVNGDRASPSTRSDYSPPLSCPSPIQQPAHQMGLIREASQKSLILSDGPNNKIDTHGKSPLHHHHHHHHMHHHDDCPHGDSCVEGLTRQLQDTSLELLLEEENEDCPEATDSAFEEESDYWMSPGLTRQNSCLESVPEHCSLSRRASLLDDDFKEPLIRRDSKGPFSRRGSMLDDFDCREPRELGRRDSLLEAVLAAKKGGWRGLVRTDSMESGASMASSLASVSSAGSDGSMCPCDDCFLGLTDLLLASHSVSSRPKKQSNWRKLRNIVQWTPFIQTYKKHKYPWVQLAGHQGNFRAGYKQGTILKKLCPPEEKALEAIMKDVLRPYVPLYMGVVEGTDGEKYLQLQDLLSDFELPCVMDIKMGVRTYLEDELAKAREKPKLRKDMFDKMVQIDPKAPTEQEHRAKAVTKPRYMVWRETISSTATQGFRIEGVRRGDGTSSKDFKTTRTREQVLTALNSFLQGYPHAPGRYVQQLKSIKVTLEASPFFNSHELIGSSLLFVHNDTSATVRMIDFAKTIPLPENVHVTHRSPWSEGTHEDGYLLGLDNLIDLFSTVEKNMAASESNKTGLQNKTPQEQTNSSGSSSDAITANKGFDDNSSNCNSTTTTIPSPIPTVNNHTAVPVNASLT